MKDYYEILDLESIASKDEIKKAYFKLVRRYPPDRYEKEFMNIREAYETLSNEKTRKEYDSINDLSSIMKGNYNLARSQMEEGDLQGAIKNLEKMIQMTPDSLVIKSLLGEAYLKNNNNGKALKVFTELNQAEPKNAAFAGYLALACLNRGWHKKAIAAYNNALKLDRDNISLWLGLADAHIANNDYYKAKDVFENALKKVTDIEDNTTIYLKLIMMNIQFSMFSAIHEYTEKLKEIALRNEEVKDNVAWTLSHIATYLFNIDEFQHAKKVIEKSAEILPNDKDILNTKEEIVNFDKYINDFERLNKDKKVKKDVTALIAFKILPKSMIGFHGDKDPEIDELTYLHEHQIIEGYEIYKSSIVRLKREYPELYKIKEDFFNKVTNNIERKKLQTEYRNKTKKYMSELNRYFEIDEDDYEEEDDFDEWYHDYEPQKPFVREEKKVGRNDPCPCGSGKKYKKCCGK